MTPVNYIVRFVVGACLTFSLVACIDEYLEVGERGLDLDTFVKCLSFAVFAHLLWIID